MSEDLPFDLAGLAAADVQSLEDTYAALRTKFSISLSDDSDIHLNDFDLFNINPNISIGGVLLINAPGKNCHLAFLKIHYQPTSGVYGGERLDYYKYQVWAFITLNKDFGRALIRHETFNDRIIGLIHPCELQFKDDKEFDHKFYIVTNNEQKALLAMNWNFRNAVMGMPDNIVLETAGTTLIIGTGAITIDPGQTIQLAEFASKIAALK